MEIHFISPFKEIAQVTLNKSILGRAKKNGYVNYHFYNLFDFADPPHYSIDDCPFGGGVGMIINLNQFLELLITLIFI